MATEPRPAIMTLHNRSAQVLTRIGDQMAYAIRFFFANPGSTSSVNEEEMASFRKLNAHHGNDPDIMASAVQQKLQEIARRYDARAAVLVRVDKKMKFDADRVLQGTYGLEILVSDQNGVPLIPTGRVVISGVDNEQIDCVFEDKTIGAE